MSTHQLYGHHHTIVVGLLLVKLAQHNAMSNNSVSDESARIRALPTKWWHQQQQ